MIAKKSAVNVLSCWILAVVLCTPLYGETLGLWHFEEGAGTMAYDTTTNNNDGTLGDGAGTAGPDWVTETPDGSDYALDFERSDNGAEGDYVAIPNNPSHYDMSEKLTLQAWIKPESANNYARIIDKNSFFLITIVNTADEHKLQFRLLIKDGSGGHNHSVLRSNSTIPLDEWSHVMAVYDGSRQYIYIDGVMDANRPCTGEIYPQPNPRPLTIGNGRLGLDRGFDGLIDRVRIDNAALYGPSGCIEKVPADFNGDCYVDLADFAELAGQWMSSYDNGISTTYSETGTGFIDKTGDLGLGNLGDNPSAWIDYNNDGWVDLYDGRRLFINRRGRGFAEQSHNHGVSVWGDYDNDGYVDKFSLARLKLWHSNESSGFEEASFPELPGLTGSVGGCWGDWDGDGYVDLYVCGYENANHGYLPDSRVQNTQGSRFEVTWTQSGDIDPARCATACDFDEDGDMDIYVSNYRLEGNLLWVNDGNGDFSNAAERYGVIGDYNGWSNSYGHTIGSQWADMDNDGHFDLFVGNFSHSDARQDRPKFYRNRGPDNRYYFEDKSDTAGLEWQESYAVPALVDYDNDGYIDLFFTTVYTYAGDNPVLYRDLGNWQFVDVTQEEGLSGLGPTYQATWADFDNDGDLDLVTDGKLFVNQGNDNHWLKLRLKSNDASVNRSALGTQARIVLDNGETVARQVKAGRGSGNQSELTLHFGLGEQVAPVDIEIIWPNGDKTTLEDVEVDQYIVLNKETADLNYDGSVDAEDLSVWIYYWLKCNDLFNENCVMK